MIPLFSFLGIDFGTVTYVTLGLWGLSFLVGFVVGSSLRHGLKLIGVILCVVVVAGLFAPSVIGSLSGVLQLINPLDWFQQLMNISSASILILCAIVGLVIGIWKG